MDLTAYLDAGSGSIILQAILGGAAAMAVALKLFWGRILTFLHIRKPLPDESVESHETETAPAPAPAEQVPAEPVR